MIYFKTKRMIFRSWTKDDLNEFIKMNKSKKVMKYFKSTLTNKESEEFYNTIVNEFEETGYGLYAVELIETNEFIGFLGFHRAKFENHSETSVEIGWRLKSTVWGQGLASEGAKACLEYGFNILRLEEVVSFTSKINIKSEAIMKKIGLMKVKEFNNRNIKQGSELELHILYKLSREEYKKKEVSHNKKPPLNIINYLLG